MADLTPQEYLQPSLLDRLTDEHPGKEKESWKDRVLSEEKLRAAVLRDLTQLLNTIRLDQTSNLDDFPEAKDSVINFGVGDLAGKTASGLNPERLERMLRETIRIFEPRIDASTLRVEALPVDDSSALESIAIEIEGDLWGEPAPSHLLLRTTLDLESGGISIRERL